MKAFQKREQNIILQELESSLYLDGIVTLGTPILRFQFDSPASSASFEYWFKACLRYACLMSAVYICCLPFVC
jgi:hypothetical protein